MSNNYENPAFKKLLKKLQEESWQLELIISGFAIFGLFSIIDPITTNLQIAQNEQQIYKFVILLVAMISSFILLFNLLLHVLLRGLWIGTLGLRYVSGDIDYDSLNYTEKFTNYLRKKVGSFDKYIGTLENYCSIIFAVSFLLIFYVLAITFTIVAIALIANYIIDNENLPGWISKGVGISLIVFIVFGMFITFFDFVTQGFLKKKKWLARLYFPVYWVFSFITLSFLYRPLVYNFLDNKFGRRLSFILVPAYLSILLLTSVTYKNSNYITKDATSDDFMANSRNYEDVLTETKMFIDDVAIQSKVITDNYVKVFVVFNESIENRIFDFNTALKPDEDIRGVSSNISFNNTFINGKKRDSLRREYLKTFNTIYSVKIDGIKYPSDFVFATSLKDELGFETYLPTTNLIDGKHVLNLRRMQIKKKDTTYWQIAKIPFWLFKD